MSAKNIAELLLLIWIYVDFNIWRYTYEIRICWSAVWEWFLVNRSFQCQKNIIYKGCKWEQVYCEFSCITTKCMFVCDCSQQEETEQRWTGRQWVTAEACMLKWCNFSRDHAFHMSKYTRSYNPAVTNLYPCWFCQISQPYE